MRLKQYISESSNIGGGITLFDDIDEFNNTIKKDCKKYFKLLGNKDPLYRGMDTDKYGLIGRRDVRQNRKSLGMPDYVAFNLNKWLKKHGHVPRDRSVFATSNRNHIDTFGYPYFIFPAGNFNYTFVLSKDINIRDNRTMWELWILEFMFSEYDLWESNYDTIKRFISYNTKDKECKKLCNKFDSIPQFTQQKEFFSDNIDKFKDCVKKVIKNYFYTNEKFDLAYKRGYEIWFDCKYFYYVNLSHQNAEWDSNKKEIII